MQPSPNKKKTKCLSFCVCISFSIFFIFSNFCKLNILLRSHAKEQCRKKLCEARLMFKKSKEGSAADSDHFQPQTCHAHIHSAVVTPGSPTPHHHHHHPAAAAGRKRLISCTFRCHVDVSVVTRGRGDSHHP